jgi:dipeptidyl aminopeptidase/acylaminoacyl peptidase
VDLSRGAKTRFTSGPSQNSARCSKAKARGSRPTGHRTAASCSTGTRQPGGLRQVGLLALPLSGDHKPLTILERTRRQDFTARLSPDGRWLAYGTDDSDRTEVFVTSFPAPTEKWQVSAEGVTMPRWRRDGRELLYVSLDGKLMGVDVEAGASFRGGVPKPLFESLPPAMVGAEFYDVAPDGQRFLMTLPADQATKPLNVIVNWTAGLDRP